jgi:hypothetical protein
MLVGSGFVSYHDKSIEDSTKGVSSNDGVKWGLKPSLCSKFSWRYDETGGQYQVTILRWDEGTKGWVRL